MITAGPVLLLGWIVYLEIAWRLYARIPNGKPWKTLVFIPLAAIIFAVVESALVTTTAVSSLANHKDMFEPSRLSGLVTFSVWALFAAIFMTAIVRAVFQSQEKSSPV